LTSKVRKLEPRPTAAPLDTPTDLSEQAVREISAALNTLLADTFALYVKTKNFHWHVTGPHFRDYHLLLDEQADQVEKSIDILAERAALRCAPLVTSQSFSGSKTMMRISSPRATCCWS
jgi:starvation-inducible DNA-binding protein